MMKSMILPSLTISLLVFAFLANITLLFGGAWKTSVSPRKEALETFAAKAANIEGSGFGACLMIKEDNELLFEWIAYHYTVLPLRYLYVGSDEGNKQDPKQVLERWDHVGSNLKYWVVPAHVFAGRHGAYESGGNKKNETREVQAHHRFVHRQRGFLTSCSEFLKSKNVTWTVYIDSDEYIVPNRLRSEENRTIFEQSVRRNLPPLDSNETMLTTLNSLENLDSCVTMPRLLFGSLENITCSRSQGVSDLAKRLTTNRYHGHAKRGDFATSKFGKVMMNLERIPWSTLRNTTPRNIHRPYKETCGNGVGDHRTALFTINHYIGSWARYSSREDSRRNRREWMARAYLSHGNDCENETFRWFHRFVSLVGKSRASYLLGY